MEMEEGCRKACRLELLANGHVAVRVACRLVQLSLWGCFAAPPALGGFPMGSEEGSRKKTEGRRKKEVGSRKKEEGRRKKDVERHDA